MPKRDESKHGGEEGSLRGGSLIGGDEARDTGTEDDMDAVEE